MQLWLSTIAGFSLLLVGTAETFMAVLFPRAISGPLTAAINRVFSQPAATPLACSESPRGSRRPGHDCDPGISVGRDAMGGCQFDRLASTRDGHHGNRSQARPTPILRPRCIIPVSRSLRWASATWFLIRPSRRQSPSPLRGWGSVSSRWCLPMSSRCTQRWLGVISLLTRSNIGRDGRVTASVTCKRIWAIAIRP